jgi:hypothetical protein
MNHEATDRISSAIETAYLAADITANKAATIAPLRELVRAFPIRVVEIQSLTYISAYEFIENATGQPILTNDTEARRLAGFLYATGNTPETALCLMLVEANDPIPRRRFTAAHELGHFILHFLTALDVEFNPYGEELTFVENTTYPDEIEANEDMPAGEAFFTRGYEQYEYSDKSLEHIEAEANAFATNLLMPEAVCKVLFNYYVSRCNYMESAVIKSLSTQLLVSQQAMRWRLRQLNLV